MELLYFISGVLVVGIGYGVKLLLSVRSSHTELLERHQSQSNIFSIRSLELNEELGDLKLLIGDIQNNMEKDQYENLSKLNNKTERILGLVNNNTNSHKVVEAEFQNIKNEIHSVKMNIKGLSEDPNFLSRYS